MSDSLDKNLYDDIALYINEKGVFCRKAPLVFIIIYLVAVATEYS